MELTMEKGCGTLGLTELNVHELEWIDGGGFLGNLITSTFTGAAVARVVNNAVKGALTGTKISPGLGTVIGGVTGILVGGLASVGASWLYDKASE